MRITNKDLENLVDRINKATGNPKTSYTQTADKKLVANIGNYHIDGAYGGVQLVQMTSEGGSIRAITPGHVTKRELYDQMQAYLSGIVAGKENSNPKN